MTLYEGDRVAIVGNNGAGKTTLMKSLAGIIKPKKGEINSRWHRCFKDICRKAF